MKCLVIFISLIALMLGASAYGQTCDPGAQPYVNAMLANEAGYTDFTADMTRVYQYCVLGTQPYASAVAGTYTKKGRDMIRIHETAELPAFNRTIYVLGSCVSEVFETGEVRRDDVAFDIAVVSDPGNYDCAFEGLDGSQGIVYFTPKPGSPPEAIVSGIRRWIDGGNGVVTRSEVYTPTGDLASVTESTVITQVGGPAGPWMPMHQEKTIYFSDTSRFITHQTDFSNVQLNTGVPDGMFLCASPVIPTLGQYSLIILAVLILSIGLYYMGRKRLNRSLAA